MSKKKKSVYAKLIANPGSGNVSGRGKLLEEVTRYLKKMDVDVDVVIAKPKEAAIPIAKRAVKDGYELIIAMGGDDTIEAVIRAIAGSKVRLGMIPVGTANNLAKGLGIPEDIKQACELIAEGRTRKLDVGQVKVGKHRKLPFFELVTIGIIAEIYPDALHARKGRIQAITGVIQKAISHVVNPKITVQMDGESSVSIDTMLAIVTNVPLIGTNMLIAPDTSSDDGLFDVSLFPNFSKAELIGYFNKINNFGIAEDGKIQRYRARKIKIKSSPKLKVMADGVMMGKGTVKIKPHKGVLRVIAPKVGAGIEKPKTLEVKNLPAPVAPAVDKNAEQNHGMHDKEHDERREEVPEIVNENGK
jgi:diacylglycerol kinase (ATP)